MGEIVQPSLVDLKVQKSQIYPTLETNLLLYSFSVFLFGGPHGTHDNKCFAEV